ncbi:DNAJB8, partial [Symbiodinium necroappetens]
MTPFVSAAAAWAALRLQRGATSLRARSFRVDEVKTTELEEALRFLGFDSFPKMKNRQSLVKWIREWRIPHQMLEGALSEVRKIRKADLRSKASAKAKAERGRESSRSGSQPRSSSRKTRRGGNLYEFTDGQLRTALPLNVCGVQGTADWHKRDLVRKLQSMGIRVKDVQALIDE